MQTQTVTLLGYIVPDSVSVPVDPGTTYIYGARIIPDTDIRPRDPFSGGITFSWQNLDGAPKAAVVVDNGPIKFVAPSSSLLFAISKPEAGGRYLVQLLDQPGEEFGPGRGPMNDGGFTPRNVTSHITADAVPLSAPGAFTQVTFNQHSARKVKVTAEWKGTVVDGAKLECWAFSNHGAINPELEAAGLWVRVPQLDIPVVGNSAIGGGVVGVHDVTHWGHQDITATPLIFAWKGSSPEFDAIAKWVVTTEVYEDTDG